MKKINIREILSLPYLMLLVLFVMSIATSYLSLDYSAKYATKAESNDGSKVAAYVFDVAEDDSTEFTLDVSTLNMPGAEPIVYKFTVTNSMGETVSEVAQRYCVAVATTGNLPLTYTLKKDDSAVTFDETSEAGKTVYSFNNSFEASTEKAHKYVLTISWDAANASEEYAEEIDYVKLNVRSEQAD